MTSSSDRIERIEALLERFITASEGGSSDRLDRIGQSLEKVVDILEQQSQQIKALVDAATRHEARITCQDALIERLDAIIERMVYREGRNGDGNDQPQP